MNKLLQKLDRAAGYWLNTMDEHLQAPLAQTLSGDALMIDTSPRPVGEAQPMSSILPAAAAPALKSADRQPVRSPLVLKPSPKR